MRQLPQSWLEPGLDPAEREFRASDALARALALRDSEEWQELTAALELQVADTLNDLARSQKDDEQNRGVIRALRHVQSMPENLIRAASAELTTHRGT